MVSDLVLTCLFFLRGKVVGSIQRVCYGDKFQNSKANGYESHKVQSEQKLLNAIVCECTNPPVPPRMCRDQRTICGSHFSPLMRISEDRI